MQTTLHMTSRIGTASAALALGLGFLVAGCGGDDDKKNDDRKATSSSTAYCEVLKAAQPAVASFTGGSPDLARFSELVTELNGISAKAPEEMAAVWKSFADPLTALDAALTDAGITLPVYIGAASKGKTPADVQPEAMAAIGTKVGALQDPKVTAYVAKIASDAKTRCGIDLKVAS